MYTRKEITVAWPPADMEPLRGNCQSVSSVRIFLINGEYTDDFFQIIEHVIDYKTSHTQI